MTYQSDWSTMLSLRNGRGAAGQRQAEHRREDQDSQPEGEAVRVACDLGRGRDDAVDDVRTGPTGRALSGLYGPVRLVVEHDQQPRT